MSNQPEDHVLRLTEDEASVVAAIIAPPNDKSYGTRGSAVILAPGLAMTAAHVTDPLVPKPKPTNFSEQLSQQLTVDRVPPPGEHAGVAGMVIVNFLDDADGDRASLTRTVTKVVRHHTSDISLVCFDVPPEAEFANQLDAKLPELGSPTVAVGYPDQKLDPTDEGVAVEIGGWVTYGEVIGIDRDGGRVRVQTSNATRSGMSGGLLLNADSGNTIGVISKSSEPGSDPYTTAVPVCELLDVILDDGAPPRTIRNLVAEGTIHVLNVPDAPHVDLSGTRPDS